MVAPPGTGLAGDGAALVLGKVFTIKMAAYVGIAPIAGAFADRVPHRAPPVTLDLVHAGVSPALPFVTEVRQAYVPIFVLRSASAGFTPTVQATIPDVLPEKARYSRALSLSRLAYDLENIVSPTLAAFLRAVPSYDALVLGTVVGFATSAVPDVSVLPPGPRPSEPRGVYHRTTRGIRIDLATPRPRGPLALNLAAAAGAVVLIDTVVAVRGSLGLPDGASARTLFALGPGSMMVAPVLPHLPDSLPDRPVMSGGAVPMVATPLGLAMTVKSAGLGWSILLMAWLPVGLGYSAVLTPSGRLLRRSAHAGDRPALFAAKFAMSHACSRVTYPLSGSLLTVHDVVPALIGLALLAAINVLVALKIWPVGDPSEFGRTPDNLPLDHPHPNGARRHVHHLVIDDQHPRWASHL